MPASASKAMRTGAVCLVLLLFAATLTPLTATAESTHNEDGTLDVLMIGNSYTSSNNLAMRLSATFDDANLDNNLTSISPGGAKISQHAADAQNTGTEHHDRLTTSTGLEYVALQDQSQVPSFPTTSEYWQDSKDGAVTIAEMADDIGAEIVLFQTWGYRNGDANNQWRNPDYPTMQAHLESGYRLYAENITARGLPVYIAPVGMAYHQLYDEVLDAGGDPTADGTLFSRLYSSDGAHPAAEGSYLAACVFHATITGKTTVGLGDAGLSIPPSDVLKLQQTADHTVFNATVDDYDFPWETKGEWTEVSGGTNETNETNESNESALIFGSNSGSNFRIEPGVAPNLAVNLTNHASFADIGSVRILTQTGWDMTWTRGSGNPADAVDFSLSPDEMVWVTFRIQVPEIVGGLPLANSKHAFTVECTSATDGNVTSWVFTIEVLPWHGAQIDTPNSSVTLDPGHKMRVPVTVRNLGNAASGLAVRVVPLDGSDNPVAGESQALSFDYDGWKAGVFDVHEVSNIGPDGTGTVQIEIEAPPETDADVRIGVRTWSGGNAQMVDQIIIDTSVLWQRAASIEPFSDPDDCETIIPGRACEIRLWLQNDGNFEDVFDLEVSTTQPWLTANVDRTQVTLAEGGATQTTLRLAVDAEADAFQLSQVELLLKRSDGEPVAIWRDVIESGAIIDWMITNFAESDDDLDNVTVAFTLTNLGNAEDGLDVTASVNVYTEFGLIPPAGAVYESEDGSPNHFEYHDIPPDTAFTFRAWFHVPRGQTTNGTAEIIIEMRSVLEPDVIFVNKTEEYYLAEKWRPENIHEPSVWEGIGEGARQFWNAWSHILLSAIVVMIGGIGLHRAVLFRQRKDAEWAEKMGHNAPPPETVDDWMGKFEEGGGGAPESIESPAMDSATFAAHFQAQSGPRQPETPAPGAGLLDAAQTVFEHHDAQSDADVMADLAADLLVEREAHPANASLEEATAVDSRTIRHERRPASPSDDDLDLDI